MYHLRNRLSSIKVVPLGWLKSMSDQQLELFSPASMRERIAAANPDAAIADGLDEALIGIDSLDCAVYSIPKILGILMTRDNMEYEDALEFFHFNIERGARHQDYAPIFVYIGDDVL